MTIISKKKIDLGNYRKTDTCLIINFKVIQTHKKQKGKQASLLDP